MIVCQHVGFRYAHAERSALLDVSCEIPEGVITALVGRSGVGKSSLIAVMAGIYRWNDPVVGSLEGSVRGNESNGTCFGPEAISWFPQVSTLLDHLTIEENVLLPLRLQGSSTGAYEECRNMLGRLGLIDYAKFRPRELSGGLKTRVAFARALISNPRMLFLDEPFTSLDLGNLWDMYNVLVETRRCAGLTTVLTTHNVPEALMLANCVFLMSRGLDDTTILERVENEPILQTGRGRDAPLDLLAEARRRAKDIEQTVIRHENRATIDRT